MSIPIYLFTGFLESGKTTLIKDTLNDPAFSEHEKTLLITCEAGEIEYEEALLQQRNTIHINVESQEEITYAFLKKLDCDIEPDRVMIEYNGTWNLQSFMELEKPFDWLIVQIISTADASLFKVHLNNMRSLIYEQFLYSEAIIFNRCDSSTDTQYLRNNIKAINSSIQIIYEAKDGTIMQLEEGSMNFDLSAKVIPISESEYGIWYMDILENPTKYKGKTVEFVAQIIATHVDGFKNAFVIGRYAMVCCADDTSLIAFLCKCAESSKCIEKTWVKLQAEVSIEFDEEMQRDVPILNYKKMQNSEPCKDEFVYFN